VLGPIADQVATDIRRALRAAPDTRFDPQVVRDLLAALGGRQNIRELDASSTRVRVGLADPKAVDERTLRSLGLRGVARPAPGRIHLLIGPDAGAALPCAARFRPSAGTR
jgi:PTS system N-acetylglucosamine-specific IIC component